MSDNVYLNRERSAVVEETDPGKKWLISREEAVRLGLLSDEAPKPQARRNATTTASDVTVSAPEDRERTFTTTASPETKKKK